MKLATEANCDGIEVYPFSADNSGIGITNEPSKNEELYTTVYHRKWECGGVVH